MTYPTHTGGGWYTLSNGERVRGKDNATEAEAQLGGNGSDEVSRYGSPYAPVDNDFTPTERTLAPIARD